MRTSRAFALASIAAMVLYATAFGAVWHVDIDNTSGNEDGTHESRGEGEGEPSYQNVSVQEAHQLWQDGIFVLDVRTTAEFEAGHIPAAHNLDVNALDDRIGEILHLREEDILVYCRSGGRSAIASEQLVSYDFVGVHNMLGGFTAWVAAGFEQATGDDLHSADTDESSTIEVIEISRVIGFYNCGSYHVDAGTPDGYAPCDGDWNGPPHDSDYDPQDWVITLPELSRLVTFYNAGCYVVNPATPDGFAPCGD